MLNTQPIGSETRANYFNLMRALLDSAWNLDEHGNKIPHVIELSADSYELWKCFERHIEPLMRVGEKYSHITDWAGKLAGAIARIAGLLHIVRYASQQPWLKAIQSEDMQAAVDIGNIMSEHALAAFEMMGADPAIEGAHVILHWIQKRLIKSFTLRECHQAHKSRFKKAIQMRPAIDVLIEEDILRRLEATNRVAHRPSEVFEVNPYVLDEQNSSF